MLSKNDKQSGTSAKLVNVLILVLMEYALEDIIPVRVGI